MVRRFELPFVHTPDHFEIRCTTAALTMSGLHVRNSAEKPAPSHSEDLKQDVHLVAEHGHAATDQ